MTDKQALRRLAIAATKGSWVFSRSGANSNVQAPIELQKGGRALVVLCKLNNAGWSGQIQTENNAKFIAAANPATVLALLDELEAAEREHDNWRTSFDNERFRADKLAEAFKTEHEQLLMANSALITQHMRANGAESRIAELEAKLAKPVLLPKTNGYWNEQEKAYEEAIMLAKRQIRLAGFRCEGDE